MQRLHKNTQQATEREMIFLEVGLLYFQISCGRMSATLLANKTLVFKKIP